MITIDSTHEEFLAWLELPEDRACQKAIDWVRQGGHNVREAWAKCEDSSFMIWATQRVGPQTGTRVEIYTRLEQKWADETTKWAAMATVPGAMAAGLGAAAKSVKAMAGWAVESAATFKSQMADDVRAAIPDPFDDAGGVA